MIQQSDINGRLALFRYGLVVVVVVTFIITLLAPYAFVANVELEGVGRLSDAEGYEAPGITAFLTEAIIATIIVAIVGVAAYFAYSYVLNRYVAQNDSSGAASAQPAGATS